MVCSGAGSQLHLESSSQCLEEEEVIVMSGKRSKELKPEEFFATFADGDELPAGTGTKLHSIGLGIWSIVDGAFAVADLVPASKLIGNAPLLGVPSATSSNKNV